MKQRYFVLQSTIILTVLILTAVTGFSQKIKIDNVGVRVGLNMSNWHYDGSSVSDLNFKTRATMESAVFTDIALSESFSLEPGIGLASYGSKVSDEIEKIEYKLNFLVVPLLAKYKLPPGVVFYAGPEIAILLSSKGELDGHETDIKNMFGKTDFMITGGIEYDFPNGIIIGARYSKGIADMYKSGSSIKLTNYSFGLNVAYQLRLK